MNVKYLTVIAGVSLILTPTIAIAQTATASRPIAANVRTATATSGESHFIRGGTAILAAFSAASLFIVYHVFLSGDGDDDNPDSN